MVPHLERKHLKQMQPAGKHHIKLHDFKRKEHPFYLSPRYERLGVKRHFFTHFGSKCILNLIL